MTSALLSGVDTVSANEYDSLPRLADANTSLGSPTISLSYLLLTLRRGWRIPLLGCIIGLTAAALYLFSTPTLYKSTAEILIDRSVNRYLNAIRILDEPSFNEVETASQIHVLSSESTIIPIVRALDLVRDPEFVGSGDRNAQNSWGIRNFIRGLKQLIGWEGEPPVEAEVALERRALEAFQKRLNVEGLGGIIYVTFASEDSKKAARIANTVVDSYLESTSDAKSKSTKMVSQLLQDRLAELKQSVVDANKALYDFKAANNLGDRGAPSSSAEQMAGVSNQLTNAKMHMAEAKARLDRLKEQANSEEAFGMLYPDNPTIVGLRAKYLDLSTRAAELEARVGTDHSAVLKLRKEKDEARSAIREEEKRLTENSYQAAQTLTNELTGMMEQLSDQVKGQNKAQGILRELEVRADSLRELYNGVLEKFNALNVQPINPVQDARIISRAAPQLYKSSKKPLALLGGGLVFGLLMGVGGAIAWELLAGVFRTPEQVKQATGLYCVSVPTFEANVKQSSSQDSASLTRTREYVFDAPYSRFTESFRKIKAMADAAKRAYGDKVLVVVSPVANNGKSTTVINLATLMADSTRTLVIDADLHRRRLTAMLEPEASEGLIEALDQPSRLASLVIKRPRSGLDFLPCTLSKRIPNAAELLGSAQMEALLTAARESYDYIIIECAPILSVVDVKMIERFVDRFVFVIEWGKTKQRVVQEALDEIDKTRDRTLCIVLNKVEPAALQMIEAYKGADYAVYYQT
jgi:polysaccharide biosynthesis transport protein